MTTCPANLPRCVSRLGGAIGTAHVAVESSGAHAVVRPQSSAEVKAAVDIVRDEALTVGVGDGHDVALDLRRMDRLLGLDETSLLVRVEAGITVGALEGHLVTRGLTLGACRGLSRTVGAQLSAPRPSEATPRGRFIDACASVEAVLADGTLITTRLAPRRATGPDLAMALIGSGGGTGILTAAHLRCRRLPPARQHAAFALPSGAAAVSVAARLLGLGIRPADLVVVDGARVNETLERSLPTGDVLLALRFEGLLELVHAEVEVAVECVQAASGRIVDAALAEAWLRPRSDVPRPERFVPLGELAAQFRPHAEIVGFTPAGAALYTDEEEPTSAKRSRGEGRGAREAILRELDPNRTFGPAQGR